jgi:TRAP-type C4-dicarboxylate transport system permease small subunit
MYEHKKQKLAPIKVYYRRLWNNAILSLLIMAFCLMLGVLGYKFTIPELDWYDSLLNASMILSGMGPIIDPDIVLTKDAKVFASMYALFSGVAFISTIGILIAPIAHRFFHKLHVEDTSPD